jgi:hypothetical protein
MTSLITHVKQIPANAGYYINVGDCRTKFFVNSGTDEVPVIALNPYAQSTITTLTGITLSTSMATPAGVTFKDMGKSLVSSGRVFRKVQLVTNSGADLVTGTAGVGGVDNTTSAYVTGYIELPGQHGMGGYYSPTPVARLG